MNSSLNSSVTDLILSSGIAAKTVLAILGICSIVSWAIILYKMVIFRRAERENRRFLSVFLKSNTLYELKKAAMVQNEGPVWSLFKNIIEKLDSSIDWEKGVLLSEKESRSIAGLERSLRSGIQDEMDYFERHVYLLATVGNTAPFIGLFGTVWGIMNSFRAIGLQESANIAVVAPGVAEALIATAAGLAAAIPAVIAYNLFVNQLGRLEVQLQVFSSELITLIEEARHPFSSKSEIV